jgi:cobalt-zinc-cadmium efflux system protein
VGAGLNAAFVIAELISGLAANSVALVADAAHNAGDVLGLLLAWGAAWLARRPPTPRRTYGWGRSSIMAALINSAVLLVSVGAIAVEAARRLLSPEPVAEATVVWVALIGVAINGFSAWLFMRGRESDLNIRAAFLHLAGDAAVSAGVVVAGLVIGLTGWFWLDPLASLAIAALILVGSWGVLRDSANLAMDAVPANLEHRVVGDYLRGVPGVAEVHDLHIWALSTTETALTAHLVCAADTGEGGLVARVAFAMRERFGIGHTTFQLETMDEAGACVLRPEDVV